MGNDNVNDSGNEPKVGLGATMVLFTDRRAMTVVEVINSKTVVVQENETRCVDYYAGEYEVLDTLCKGMRKSVFTLRKSGRWVEKGQPDKYGSTVLVLGVRRHYIDPSF